MRGLLHMSGIEMERYAQWCRRFAEKADALRKPRMAAYLRACADVASTVQGGFYDGMEML